MQYVHDGMFHDSLRAHFQTVDIVRLNEVLAESGITDKELRRKVLDNYFFAAGQFFDNGWFEADGRRFAPGVYFQEVNSSFKLTDHCYLPGPDLGTLFHEFAGGTVEMLFEPDMAEHLEVQTGELES